MLATSRGFVRWRTSRRRAAGVLCLLPALALCASVTAQPAPHKLKSNAKSPASPAQDTTATTPPKSFRFDAGVSLSPGLSFTFERSVPTIDGQGNHLPPDQPRFEQPSTIASVVTPELVRPAQYGTTILGSGVDHDGVTPILVVKDSALNAVDVFSVEDVPAADASGIGRVRTSLGSGFIDIMGGTVPNRRFDPRAGVVCHGLIVLACSVSYQPVPPLSAWVVRSIALVVSQDRGRSWQLLFEDASVQENRERLREWSLQNWWPDESGGPVLNAYVAAADYRSKPGCDGGRVVAFRTSRAAVGGGWIITPPTLIYETPTPGAGQHVHAAGIVPHNDGLRLIVGIGDTQSYSRVVSSTRADTTITPSGWSTNENFHGSMGTGGNQFVGCAPGPLPETLILGSDLCQEQLMLLDARTGEHTWLYGNGWANALPSQNFVIRTPFPDRRGPYCATYEPQQNSTMFPPGSRRLLYSQDGIHWAQACAPMTQSTWAAAIHGNHIYIDGDGVAKLGLRRIERPPVMHTARPLRVGPGALQRLTPSPIFNAGAGGTITPLSRNPDGLWIDGGVPLNPQPPCNGPVWKLTGTLGSTDTRIADIFPINSPTMGAATGSSRIIGRVWVMNLLNKSLTARIELKPNAAAVIESRNLNISSSHVWAPIDLMISAAMPAGQRPVLRVRSATGGSDTQAFYLATDWWAEGEGSPGYPIGPDTAPRGDGTVYPDERARISGFATGDAWTISLVGMLPFDGVDPSVQSKVGATWPIASICVGESHNAERLVFAIDPPAHALWAELWRNGAIVGTWRLDGLVWLRQSQVMLSVARPGPDADLEITVAACGTPPALMNRLEPDGTPLTLVGRPTAIRFDDGTRIDGAGVEIRTSPMLWFGGEIHESAALPGPERAARFRTLPFLTTTSP